MRKFQCSKFQTQIFKYLNKKNWSSLTFNFQNITLLRTFSKLFENQISEIISVPAFSSWWYRQLLITAISNLDLKIEIYHLANRPSDFRSHTKMIQRGTWWNILTDGSIFKKSFWSFGDETWNRLTTRFSERGGRHQAV